LEDAAGVGFSGGDSAGEAVDEETFGSLHGGPVQLGGGREGWLGVCSDFVKNWVVVMWWWETRRRRSRRRRRRRR
jgi:hypothetical protein